MVQELKKMRGAFRRLNEEEEEELGNPDGAEKNEGGLADGAENEGEEM